MNAYKRHTFTSRISIIGLFAVLSFVFTLPILILFVQQQQHIGSTAFFPTTSITQSPTPAGYIAGYVYQDDNQNGVRDPEEKPFSNISVQINTIAKGAPSADGKVAQIVSDTKTDSSGYFFYRISDPNVTLFEYVVRVVPPVGYRTIDTNPVLLTNVTIDTKELLQFGLFQRGRFAPSPTLSVSTPPRVTCIPRPACLDSNPRCLIAEPAEGWCPNATPQ